MSTRLILVEAYISIPFYTMISRNFESIYNITNCLASENFPLFSYLNKSFGMAH